MILCVSFEEVPKVTKHSWKTVIPTVRKQTIAPSTRRCIIFVNRFFYPDQSATSQILSDLAFALAENGESVRVVASGRGKSELTPELINSVRVYRTRAADLSSFGLVGRACEYATFYFAATQILRRVVRPGDIVVAK